MPDLNAAFQANPLDFARKYAIDGGAARGLEPNQALAAFKAKGPDDDKLFQVKGQGRIIGCEIAFSEENALAQNAAHGPIGQVKVRPKKVGAAGSFPIYWLPWVKDGLVRTTLRPQRARHDPQVDPDFFFTAGLDGCMVFVEGERDQPTVYHANAGSTSGAGDARQPRDLLAQDLDGLARACIQAKVDNMEASFRAKSRAHPKLARDEANPAAARPALPATAGAVKQTDYLVYGEGPPNDEKTALIAALGARSTTGRLDEITIEKGQGTAFGVRDSAGLWAFYYQKTIRVARIRFTKRSGWAQRIRGKEEWKPHVLPVEWVATEVKQFWPNAGGAARFEIGRGIAD